MNEAAIIRLELVRRVLMYLLSEMLICIVQNEKEKLLQALCLSGWKVGLDLWKNLGELVTERDFEYLLVRASIDLPRDVCSSLLLKNSEGDGRL